MSQDWYDRLLESGVMDTLAPYNPVVVGAYPLGIPAPHSRIEIVCRSVDLPAFARVVERSYGDAEGFAMHPGRLDEEEAVFAEFELDGLPLEVAAQPDHVHQRLAAATIGISRMLDVQGDTSGPGWRRPSPAARTGWTPRCCRPTCRGRRSKRSRPRTRR